jgi:hypothetical protein
MPRKALAGPTSEPRIHELSHRDSQRPVQEHRVLRTRPRGRYAPSRLRSRHRAGRAGSTAKFGASSPVWQGCENEHCGAAGERVPAGQ